MEDIKSHHRLYFETHSPQHILSYVRLFWAWMIYIVMFRSSNSCQDRCCLTSIRQFIWYIISFKIKISHHHPCHVDIFLTVDFFLSFWWCIHTVVFNVSINTIVRITMELVCIVTAITDPESSLNTLWIAFSRLSSYITMGVVLCSVCSWWWFQASGVWFRVAWTWGWNTKTRHIQEGISKQRLAYVLPWTK